MRGLSGCWEEARSRWYHCEDVKDAVDIEGSHAAWRRALRKVHADEDRTERKTVCYAQAAMTGRLDDRIEDTATRETCCGIKRASRKARAWYTIGR